jgi:hypothetical protein
MSTYKNTSGDLTLTGDGGLATLTVNYANTVFNGSLTYTGNLTTVDDFIVVAANNTGTVTEMGLLGQTGPTTFAGLRFNSVANAWQISNSVSSSGAPIASYANLITTTSAAAAAGANTQIQFNNSGAFGATANLSFDTATNKLFLSGHQVFANTATPANVANAVAVYSNVVGGGGTGLYFTSASANDELVSKGKAIVYGIIF